MARRRTGHRRGRSSKGDAAAVALIFGLIGAAITACVWLITHFVRWYIDRWQRADRRGRSILAGGLIGALVVMCGLGGLSNSTTQTNSFAASFPATQTPLAVISRISESDTIVPTPSATPSPTALPASPTPERIPPTGNVAKGGNLRSEPHIAPKNVIGQLCVGDTVDFLSLQTVEDSLWYRIHVTKRVKDCGSQQAAIGTEGWVSNLLVSAPSYPIEQYAQAANVLLPTTIIQPTATPKPTAVPKPTARPKPTVKPQPALAPSTGGGRIGAICRDGTHSNATGRGACSHHGGVDHWLYG